MSPWAIVGTLVLWGASLAGTAAWFYGAGQDAEIATQAKLDSTRQETRALAAEAAASAIAAIEVRHVTIRQKLERVVQEREVFRDCRSGPDAVRLLNDSPGVARAASGSGSGGELPAAGSAR